MMRSLRSMWFPFFLGISTSVFFWMDIVPRTSYTKKTQQLYREGDEWRAPDESAMGFDDNGELIQYGKQLIANTATYLGPKGIVAQISNGMNCQNCHTYAGTQNFSNPFSAVASLYPLYRSRSGILESIEFRINDCMQRSMNGQPLDSVSREMRAMVAYIKWVGHQVPKGVRPKGAGIEKLPFLNRPADPQKGQQVFINHCQRCHGQNGEGVLTADATGFVYPPLWGNQSYNIGAGLYRLSTLAGFIKNNMPYGVTWKEPVLTAEQAWDVAAFIASQPRPVKSFPHDWKDSSKKPFDHPFGPYADSFTEAEHKYGPFAPIVNNAMQRKGTSLQVKGQQH